VRSFTALSNQESLTFYITPVVNTAFTAVGCVFVCWARWIQSTPFHPSFFKDQHSYHPHIYAYIFQVVSSVQVSQARACVNYSHYACHVSRPSNLAWFGPYTSRIHVHVSITCGLEIHIYQVEFVYDRCWYFMSSFVAMWKICFWSFYSKCVPFMTMPSFVKRGLENYSSNDPKKHVGLIVVTNRILK
jgi:hypothetical protein